MTDILNNISATSMNILMLLLGAVVSFYLFGLIVACVEGLVANSYGARTVSFSFLWWKWQKLSSDGTTVSEKGKWKVSKSKFRIIAELLYIRTNITAEQEKKIRRHTYLILLIIALPVLAGTFFAGYFLPAPFRYFFFGLLIMLTLLAVTVFRTRNWNSSGQIRRGNFLRESLFRKSSFRLWKNCLTRMPRRWKRSCILCPATGSPK